MILDTQFLGNLVEQKSHARQKAAELDECDVALRVPSAVVWEIYYEIGNSRDSKRITLQRGYKRLFRALPVVDLDDGLARRAGALRGKHARADRLANLDGADSVVAATSLSLGEAVISNDRDFEDVAGLELKTY